MKLDCQIRRAKEELEGTGFMEVGPGRYKGEHWQDGFLFLWEHAFAMAEGILIKHLPSYDHCDMNDIPVHVGKAVIAEWETAAAILECSTADEAVCVLNLQTLSGAADGNEVVQNAKEIAFMLQELARECKAFYTKEDWICVLGM